MTDNTKFTIRKQPTILQVLPSLHSGGVERGTVEIARASAKAGFNAIVASNGGYMETEVRRAGAEHFKLPLKSKNPFTIWRNIARLEKIINEYKVDIIHARSRGPAWSAYFAAKRSNIKFLTTFHGLYSHGSNLKRKYNSVMVKGEKVIAISNFIADHIKENYDVPEEKIRVIHRGVDFKHFNYHNMNQERMIKLTKLWNLPGDLPIIMLPGRITRWKGQNFLLESLALLPHRNFFCVFVGSDIEHPAYLSEIKKTIDRLDLSTNCRVVGSILDMPAAYRLASLVVSASVKPEAFGRVAVEGMAMGRPVIATDLGAARETVKDGETGWLVEPGNTEAMARKIDEVLNLPADEIKRVTDNAVMHTKENFSIVKMYEKTIALYRELLGG